MKLHSSKIRNFLLLSAVTLLVAAPRGVGQTQASSQSALAQVPAVPARITQAIDETQLVRLKGNVHPLARAEFDQGPVSSATPMKRMMLLLQRSPEQETALEQFMAEQMSKESPNFHKWLTPEQFGVLYGPADADTQTVTTWLSSRGFTAIRVAPGRNVIEFSGNVGQVRSAFHTDIHQFVVMGEQRQSNVSDPQIPAALIPVVGGIVSLHNFPPKSMRHVVGQFTHSRTTGETIPLFTTSGGNFAVGPADFAKIYNIPASLDGTGANIAIIGFSDIDLNDARDFRALFGLPANDPVIVNNGPDPGFNGEEGEADLDTQWSGAVAPKATIHYILSEGTLTSDALFLGAEYVVDNNSDDAMSLSFGVCEPQLGAAANSFLNALWQQAAAQGITVTVSAGDNGSAGCDDFNSQSTAVVDLAVNGIASTPFNIAVGGTDFDDVGIQTSGGFWSTTNGTGKLSAQGYIHEVPWNVTCAATATPPSLTTCASPADPNLLNIVAASGGPSAVYLRPAFQNGIIPNGIVSSDAANHRYLPDVSLFASSGFAGNSSNPTPLSRSFYVLCQADALQPGSSPSCASTGPFSFFGAGGTSASSPAFAGVIALIGQSEANAGRSRRQGNANLVLYQIAQTAANSCDSSTQPLAPPATCVFYDVTKGNNSVPCAAGSPHCSSLSGANGVEVTVSGTTKTPAFTANAGTASIPSYDLATGLGTVNIANLATAWATAVGSFKATTSTLKINGSSTPATITHGTAVTATVTVAVVSPATGTPTGDVSVLGPFSATQTNGGGNDGTLSGGTVTLNNVILAGGSPVNLTAHYAGDGTFAPSDSTPVSITVNKENSSLQVGIVTFDSSRRITNTNATSFAYGSPYILRFDILKSTGTCQLLNTPPSTSGCAFDATGTVTVTDNGSPLDEGTFHVNAEGSGEDQPIQLPPGTHNLSAAYSGDNSYNAPAAASALPLTVSKATTNTQVLPSPSSITTSTSVTLTATIHTQSNGAAPTGTVQFLNGSTPISGTVTYTGQSGAQSATGFATLTATLTTTLSVLPVAPTPRGPLPFAPLLILACVSVILAFLTLKLSQNKRRGYVYASLLLLTALAAGIAGCSGGSSGPKTIPISAQYSGDTNYSSSSGSTTVTKQ